MLDRMVQGAVPRKHHIAFRDAEGRLLHEEAFTRAGFDGATRSSITATARTRRTRPTFGMAGPCRRRRRRAGS